MGDPVKKNPEYLQSSSKINKITVTTAYTPKITVSQVIRTVHQVTYPSFEFLKEWFNVGHCLHVCSTC